MLRFSPRKLLVRALVSLLRLLTPAQSDLPPARVLVIKPDHLGDVLLLTPALRALRQALPGARIFALLGPWGEPVLSHTPDVDSILTCPFPGFTRSAVGRKWAPYVLLFRMALLLRAGRFDGALIARDDHWWGALLALAAGIPRRIGFAHPLVAPALTEALPWDANEHVVHQALALVERLTRLPTGHLPLRFEPTAEEHGWAEQWLARHTLGRRPMIAIHPGTGGSTKRWPPASWAAVADALSSQVDIVLTGGPGEEGLVDEIATAMRAPCVSMVGQATIGELAAFYARCAAVLGVDSGPLHVAVSQGVPTIHLFGPSDPQRFGPWGDERNVVLRSGIWCSPCGVFGHCPRRTDPVECMASLGVEQVVAIAQRLLSRTTSRSVRSRL